MSGTAVATRSSRTRTLATASLVTALMAASAWVSIPLGSVPVTLQVFIVILAALLLDPIPALAAMLVYVAMGAAGVPVFSGGMGGIGALAGPTGGYLSGFVLAAFSGSSMRILLGRHFATVVSDIAAAVCVVVVTYMCGVAQLAVVARMSVWSAIAAGALPFIALDGAKAAVAIPVAAAIRRARVGARPATHARTKSGGLEGQGR